MIACGKCGTENSPSAKYCQMCASPLTAADAASEKRTDIRSDSSLNTTAVFSIEPPDALVCPVCEAENEGGWAFCQQCGSKLGQSSPGLPSGAERKPERTYATTIKASQLLDELKKGSPASGVTCPTCSQALVVGAAFCHKCGGAISSARTVAMSSLKPSPKARLLLIIDGEATGDEFAVKGDTVIGRIDGDITFPHDDYMSGRHASISRRGDKFMLIDEDSRNGSFIRIRREVELKPGDYILLGKQLFRFEF